MARLRTTGVVNASSASLSPSQITRVEAPISAIRETRSTPRKETPTKATPSKATPNKPTPTKATPRSSSRRNTPLKPDSIKKVVAVMEEINGAVEAPSPQADAGEASDETEVLSLSKHRVDKPSATVDFLVNWAGGEATWESESDLQVQVPDLVYAYWDTHGGREETTKLDTYCVFKILKRTTASTEKLPRYHIQWVGYRRKESTWEPEEKIREIAPEQLEEYEAKHGAATQTPAPAQKRSHTRGVGRPRKKAKTVAADEE